MDDQFDDLGRDLVESRDVALDVLAQHVDLRSVEAGHRRLGVRVDMPINRREVAASPQLAVETSDEVFRGLLGHEHISSTARAMTAVAPNDGAIRDVIAPDRHLRSRAVC